MESKMQFLVEFLKERVPHLRVGEKALYGRIRIGDFEEKFVVCLDYWDADKYRCQWVHGLTRLLNSAKRSCLITALPNPKTANFIVWWPIYRVDDTLYFQNQCLLLKNLKSTFDCRMPYRHVGKRTSVNPSGDRISEWSLPIEEVRKFLAYQRETGEQGNASH
jgi:hypothetical protein